MIGEPSGAINDSMAQLIVRNVHPSVVRALKLRAAQRGHSAEAEHRDLLEASLLKKPRGSFKEMLQAMPEVGRDTDFRRSKSGPRRVRL